MNAPTSCQNGAVANLATWQLLIFGNCFCCQINNLQAASSCQLATLATGLATAFSSAISVSYDQLPSCQNFIPLRGVCMRAKTGARTPHPRGLRERVHDPPQHPNPQSRAATVCSAKNPTAAALTTTIPIRRQSWLSRLSPCPRRWQAGRLSFPIAMSAPHRDGPSWRSISVRPPAGHFAQATVRSPLAP